MRSKNLKSLVKFNIIVLILLTITGNTEFAISQDEASNFSRAKILSVDTSSSTIKIVDFIGIDRNYYTLKVPDTTVITKDDKTLKLSELKTGYITSITYTKDEDRNKIATSISVLSSQ